MRRDAGNGPPKSEWFHFHVEGQRYQRQKHQHQHHFDEECSLFLSHSLLRSVIPYHDAEKVSSHVVEHEGKRIVVVIQACLQVSVEQRATFIWSALPYSLIVNDSMVRAIHQWSVWMNASLIATGNWFGKNKETFLPLVNTFDSLRMVFVFSVMLGETRKKWSLRLSISANESATKMANWPSNNDLSSRTDFLFFSFLFFLIQRERRRFLEGEGGYQEDLSRVRTDWWSLNESIEKNTVPDLSSMYFVFLSTDTRRFDWDIACPVRWDHFVQRVTSIASSTSKKKAIELTENYSSGNRSATGRTGRVTNESRIATVWTEGVFTLLIWPDIEKETYTADISNQHRWNTHADIHNHRR